VDVKELNPMASHRQKHGTSTTGLIHFSKEGLEAIDEALETLVEKSSGRCALVIDRTGCILSFVGDFHPLGKETMGATAAGVIAALNTMVSSASSPEVSIKLYGSDIDKIHFYVVADRLILCVLYAKRTTAGQIRTAARDFVNTINPILEKEKISPVDPTNLFKSVQFIESKLDDVFKDIM
jgi:predicted regulator of Ras-like GTPase activity (Roadblock/LC7/MglB family)